MQTLLSPTCPLLEQGELRDLNKRHVNTLPGADSAFLLLKKEILTTPSFLMCYWNSLFRLCNQGLNSHMVNPCSTDTQPCKKCPDKAQ